MSMFNELPEFVILQNNKYKINTDFRHMIKFEKIIKDKSTEQGEKIIKALKCFYPYFYDNINELIYNTNLYKEACKKMIWFYLGGKEQKENNSSGKNGNNSQIYNYDYDDEYIWEAFYRHYRIDLTKDKLHWWKFRAIIKSLPEDTQFNKIKGYRSYNGDNKELNELKKFYELPLDKEEQKRLNELYNMLK